MSHRIFPVRKHNYTKRTQVGRKKKGFDEISLPFAKVLPSGGGKIIYIYIYIHIYQPLRSGRV